MPEQRFTATKEEAGRMLDGVESFMSNSPLRDDLMFFLEACKKRLPSTAAVKRDSARRKKPTQFATI